MYDDNFILVYSVCIEFVCEGMCACVCASVYACVSVHVCVCVYLWSVFLAFESTNQVKTFSMICFQAPRSFAEAMKQSILKKSDVLKEHLSCIVMAVNEGVSLINEKVRSYSSIYQSSHPPTDCDFADFYPPVFVLHYLFMMLLSN